MSFWFLNLNKLPFVIEYVYLFIISQLDIFFSYSSKRRERETDLNLPRYILRGPRYWIPPDNSALNHLVALEDVGLERTL